MPPTLTPAEQWRESYQSLLQQIRGVTPPFPIAEFQIHKDYLTPLSVFMVKSSIEKAMPSRTGGISHRLLLLDNEGNTLIGTEVGFIVDPVAFAKALIEANLSSSHRPYKSAWERLGEEVF
jgi:hypothetical protein